MARNKQFPALVKEWWRTLIVDVWEGHKLLIKLKLLKGKIKEWVRLSYGDGATNKACYLAEIQSLDRKKEVGTLS